MIKRQRTKKLKKQLKNEVENRPKVSYNSS